MKLLGELPIDQKKIKGQELNKLKTFIEDSINDHKILIENTELERKLKDESIDVTLPHTEEVTGKIHPISQTIFSITEIFGNLNYSVEAGPDIESDFNNFSALNIPPHHPAREMQDTFYVNNSDGENNVLRTHTSPVQIRSMLKSNPPIAFTSAGKVYRKDDDSTHLPMFHQVEGIYVDKNVTFANLKGILNEFISRFFGDNIKTRFRPSYFPFTEPSAELDIEWKDKNGSKTWMEVLGCGMVNPKVFESVNYNSDDYTGLAFGMGIERLAMIKFGITDIRYFYQNDLKFLKQF